MGFFYSVVMRQAKCPIHPPTDMEVDKMKFLCLAYGNEDGWNSLSQSEKQEVLASDAVIRDRGNLMSAVQPKVTSVRNWYRNLEITEEPFTQQNLPLAGFSVIEAESLKEVIELVSNTPCARARGVIEIRPFWDFGNDGA
jgi:hypothetical protein